MLRHISVYQAELNYGQVKKTREKLNV